MKTCQIAALCLLLIACAGTTARIEPDRLSEVRKGQTTAAEIVRQFGRPSVLSKNPDGTQTALYLQNDGQSTGTIIVPLIATAPRDSVTFYFDTSGVLTDLKTTQAAANKPAPVDATKTMQVSTDKPASASVDKPAPASAGKIPQSNTNTWSLPSWLPSSSEQRR